MGERPFILKIEFMSRKRNRRTKIDRRILILLSITPIGCLLAMLAGLVVAWYLFPTRFVNAKISDLSPDEAQQVVIMAAADFAEHEDIDRAHELLAELKVPNTAQYVSMVAEQMVRTNRGEVDQDVKNVVRLADALGVSTVSMIAYVSTPTPVPTETPVPTDTPPPTPTPTNTLVVEATPTPDAAALAAAATEEVPPTETATPEPAAPPPTPVPVPPTDTPAPTETPKPEFDFIVTKQRLMTKDENGGCAGNHNIYITVVDAAGTPINGVEIGDVWNNPGPKTEPKNGKEGQAEYLLFKNGFKIFVKNDPTAGRPVTSQVTELLSSNDWEIGIPKLIEAGYCPDEGTCSTLWNSGVFGVGNNSLCWGHYSWEVVFQRTW
ncbi:MAG: hypothetical protein DPW09_20555 [Anaerolineae bacterium]|nr:hypothetical protein [Anaerolineae bacterium]